jgi:hypothetical protein
MAADLPAGHSKDRVWLSSLPVSVLVFAKPIGPLIQSDGLQKGHDAVFSVVYKINQTLVYRYVKHASFYSEVAVKIRTSPCKLANLNAQCSVSLGPVRNGSPHGQLPTFRGVTLGSGLNGRRRPAGTLWS